MPDSFGELMELMRLLDVFAPEEYIDQKDNENAISSHDFALLILKKPIGNETGYF